MSATITQTKVAVVRNPDGSLYLNCRCGARPNTPGPDARIDQRVTCACGRRFYPDGWIITEPA